MKEKIETIKTENYDLEVYFDKDRAINVSVEIFKRSFDNRNNHTPFDEKSLVLLKAHLQDLEKWDNYRKLKKELTQ